MFSFNNAYNKTVFQYYFSNLKVKNGTNINRLRQIIIHAFEKLLKFSQKIKMLFCYRYTDEYSVVSGLNNYE